MRLVVILFSLFSGIIRAAGSSYPRVIAGPRTGRGLEAIRSEMTDLYPSCADLLADVRGRVVIDIGSGHGSFVSELKQHLPDLRAYRLDLQPTEFEPRRGDFVRGHADHLPFANQSVHRLFASYTIYLWTRDDETLIARALAETARVLETGGRLIVIAGDPGPIRAAIARDHLPLRVTRQAEDLCGYIEVTRF